MEISISVAARQGLERVDLVFPVVKAYTGVHWKFPFCDGVDLRGEESAVLSGLVLTHGRDWDTVTSHDHTCPQFGGGSLEGSFFPRTRPVPTSRHPVT